MQSILFLSRPKWQTLFFLNASIKALFKRLFHRRLTISQCFLLSVYDIGYHTYTFNETTHTERADEEILSVSYEDGKWSKPYFDCGGGDIWMMTYTVPFFGYANGTYFFKQVYHLFEISVVARNQWRSICCVCIFFSLVL